MKNSHYLVIAIAGVMLVLSLPQTSVAKQDSNNILFIAADDFGIDALGLYTDQLDLTPDQEENIPPTPTIDSLAESGVTFNNAWANPLCSPTRGTLITGRYGFRTGITWPVGRFTAPGVPGGGELDVDDTELLPKLLKEKGYATAMIGKYHLTSGPNAPSDPITTGFDYYAGSLGGFTPYFNWQQTIDELTQPQPTFATTENVNQARDFIVAQEAASIPWFVSLNLAAPHFPYTTPPITHVDPGVVAQVEAAVNAEGGDWANWEYKENASPTPQLAQGTEISALPNTLEVSRAVLNALVSAMDNEIGTLLNAVDMDKTSIIFIGDNGTAGNIPPLFNAVAPPFDPNKAKVTLYEGGIRVPMVVYDPSIKNPGRFSDALINTVDIYAMILKIAGCPSPNRFDGKQFNAVLQAPNNNVSVRNYIYAEQSWQDLDGTLPPNALAAPEGHAIRNDRYKLIRVYVEDLGQPELEFYDLLVDPDEENNLLLGDLTNKKKSNYDWLLNKLETLLSSQ